MKKKPILLIAIVVAIISTAAIAIFVIHAQQRQDNLMELVLWPEGGRNRGVPIYYFVVTNDGVLIGYHGLSRRHSDHNRRHNFVRTVRERQQVVLSEEEFLYISELSGKIVSDTSDEGGRLGSSFVLFLHNGYTYDSCSFKSEPLVSLIHLLFELTSLSGRGSQ